MAETLPPAEPRISSVTLGIVLAVVAVLPVIRVPMLQAASLDTTLGQWAYGLTVFTVAVWMYVTHQREEKLRKWETMQQAESNKTLTTNMAELTALVRTEIAARREMDSLVLRGVPATDPVMVQLAGTIRTSQATITGMVHLPPGGPFRLTGEPQLSPDMVHAMALQKAAEESE